MAMLLFEGDGLPLNCSDYFPTLRKMSTSVRVMGIFDEMGCNFTALFEVQLPVAGIAEAERIPVRCRK